MKQEPYPWSDAQLSAELPDIQIAGEGQHVEFKRELDTDDVRREIAAFATAGGGRLFIGIDDDNRLYGMDIEDVKIRDQIGHRLDGIARSVKPAVKFKITLAVADLQVVACVNVESKQDHPVFYANQKPYIRDGRSSRPAEPEEVQEQVWAHPSSEQRRNLERLQLESMAEHSRQMAEQRQRSADQMHELNQSFIQRR